MSQLSQTAKVVWLLELTATIRPNSAVMSIAEEAGITHFKTLLQGWAHPVYCCRRTWAFQISAKSIQSHCSSPKKVGVVVITQWFTNLAAPTASCSKCVWKKWLGGFVWGGDATHRKSDVCPWVQTYTRKHMFYSFFYFTLLWCVNHWVIN